MPSDLGSAAAVTAPPTLLTALALAACSGASPVAKEPCERGMAVTADGEAHATIPDAVARALELDGVVDVCPGRHEIEGYLEAAGRDAPDRPLTLRGAGMDQTSLAPTGESCTWGADDESPNQVLDLAIENSGTRWLSDACSTNGESDVECDSPFDHNGDAEGALLLSGSWVLERVRISDNSGYWGGAFTLRQPMDNWSFSVTFIDSEIVRNQAVDGTSGGALLVDYNDDWGPRGELTITSVNTDWGAGDDDNTPDDIAFASWDGYFHDTLTVHASYRFEGVADFTCSALSYTCE